MNEIYLSIATLIHIVISIKEGPRCILLTCRSLVCTWNHLYETPVHYNYFACLVTMILQDVVGFFAETNLYWEPWSNDVLQYFMLENEYTSYFPIFTVQLAPFIPKKLHDELFNTNMIAIVTTDYMFAPVCYCACWYIDYMHRLKKENKYLCWMIIFVTHSLIKQSLSNIKYVPQEFVFYPWYYMSAYLIYFIWNKNAV
jgi:hypothetical protein